ncbi:methyltransferase [Streptomyces sp. NPDC055025]
MAMNEELDRIRGLALGFMGARVMQSAVELGVFAALTEGGPASADGLRAKLGLHERGATDFFDCLVALDLLTYEDGCYANTPTTTTHLGDPESDSYIGGMLEYAGSHWYWSWGKLTDALRTGRSQSYGGESPYDAIHSDPELVERFQRAMAGATPGAVLIDEFPWREVSTVADVGCSDGAMLIRLLRAQPHLSGIGFDLPTSGPAFEKAVARGGLDDRLSFAGGDFRTSGFPAADAVVFGHILIDWDVEVRRMLLAKAYEALPEGGSVLVYDTLVGEDRRDSAGALIVSLHMLVDQRGGKGYTTEECFGWLKDAGFRDCRVQPLSGTTDHLITAVK